MPGQPLGVARVDPGAVEVAGDEVDRLDEPHQDHHRGDQDEAAGALALRRCGVVAGCAHRRGTLGASVKRRSSQRRRRRAGPAGRTSGRGRRAGARPRGPGASGGMPNGSDSPWTISTGTSTASSSRGASSRAARAGAAGRRGRGRRPRRSPAAVRQATRAPEERPPHSTGPAPAQLLDDREPCGVELVRRARATCGPRRGRAARPARRETPAATAASAAVTRSGAVTPPPAPWPSTSSARGAVDRMQSAPAPARAGSRARAAPRFASLRRGSGTAASADDRRHEGASRDRRRDRGARGGRPRRRVGPRAVRGARVRRLDGGGGQRRAGHAARPADLDVGRRDQPGPRERRRRQLDAVRWPEFTPPLPSSDAPELRASDPPSTFTLALGGPVVDPILHLASLGSELTFPAGTRLVRRSGDAGFAVSGTSSRTRTRPPPTSRAPRSSPARWRRSPLGPLHAGADRRRRLPGRRHGAGRPAGGDATAVSHHTDDADRPGRRRPDGRPGDRRRCPRADRTGPALHLAGRRRSASVGAVVDARKGRLELTSSVGGSVQTAVSRQASSRSGNGGRARPCSASSRRRAALAHARRGGRGPRRRSEAGGERAKGVLRTAGKKGVAAWPQRRLDDGGPVPRHAHDRPKGASGGDSRAPHSARPPGAAYLVRARLFGARARRG